MDERRNPEIAGATRPTPRRSVVPAGHRPSIVRSRYALRDSVRGILCLTPVTAVREVHSFWRFTCGISDERLDRVVTLLDQKHQQDVARFSGVFEPSFSHDDHGWHPVRFSYAFPDFWVDQAPVMRTILDAARPFGVSRWVARLCRSALEGFVEQPIIGLAYDGPKDWTFKVYFQVHPEAQDAAAAWLCRFVSWSRLRLLVQGSGLHLIGMDLGPEGFRTVKLYLMHPDGPVQRLSGGPIPSRLGEHLIANGIPTLKDLLSVHRMRFRDDPDLLRPSEIDFPLDPNGLDTLDGLGRVLGGPGAPDTAPFIRGSQGTLLDPVGCPGLLFRVVRVSLSATGTPKVNWYYHPVRPHPS